MPPFVESESVWTITFKGRPLEVIRPVPDMYTFWVVFMVRVRVAAAVSVTIAPVFHAMFPEELEELAAEARKRTSLAVNSFCKVVAETFELDAVASQMPVVPKKAPLLSVEPETTERVSA